MQVEQIALSDITPYARNPRVNDEAVTAVARSIQEFGWQQPIVVDKSNVIIVGDTRYRAALSLGLRKAPVVIAKGLTKAKVKAYRIADNKVGEIATWDDALLKLELGDLILDPGEDTGAVFTGFMGDELAAFLEEEPEKPAAVNGKTVIDADTYGGATALSRSASAPLRYWKKHQLLQGSVLDFGSGTEQHDFARYDIVHAAEVAPLLVQYDTVMCNYVLNVQPTDHLVDLILSLLLHLTKKKGTCLIAIETKKQGAGSAASGGRPTKTPTQWALILDRFFEVEKVKAGFCGFVCRR